MAVNSDAARVNVCGVPESEWENNWCKKCRGGCEMTPSVIVDERAYQYAYKHGLLTGATWYLSEIYQRLAAKRKPLKLPKYFRASISQDGLAYDTLDAFPMNIVLQVCRDSQDETFRAGDLVYRDEDGINIVQEAACLDASDCNQSLQGAMFSVVGYAVSEFKK